MEKNRSKFKETEIGPIPEEWKVLTIGKIGAVVGGGTPSTSSSSYYGGDISWITPRDLSGYENVYISRGERNITELGLKNSSARLLPKGTVLFSSRAPIGYVAIAGDEVSTNQGFKSIVCDPKVADNVFVYYLLKFNKESIENIAVGSTFKEVSGSAMANFEVKVPPLDEQKRIAEILSSLDEKIELNRRMNKTLEEIAQALFRRWFVDFEFPADSESRDEAGRPIELGKPYRSSGGKMIDSDLGPIPEGWRVASLDEFLNLERGLSYKGKYLCDDGVPMINLGTFELSGGFKEGGLKYYNGEYKGKNIVHYRDIVIANTDITQSRDILGSAVLVPGNLSSRDILFTHHVYAVRILSEISQQFLLSLLTAPEFKANAVTYATGTTVLFLPKSAILDYKFILPKGEIQKVFENLGEDIKKRADSNNAEASSLMRLREILLPRLMSGKIRVDKR